jgi:hypothetical protein
LTGALPLSAQQPVTRVEEDWVLRANDPDAALTAPQFTTVMTPDQTEPSTYFTLEFNHSTSPEFQPGGIQLQAWRGDEQEDVSDRLSDSSLDIDSETIHWTQFMEIQGSDLVFGMSSLTSTTWSDVDVSPRVVLTGYGQSSLNDYQHSDSSGYSTVGYSGNRVAWMYLVRVRLYSGNQLVQTIEINQNVNGH